MIRILVVIFDLSPEALSEGIRRIEFQEGVSALFRATASRVSFPLEH